MALVLSLNSDITVDESGLLQNQTASPSVAGDANDNDISIAAINGTNDSGDLPDEFESRLFTLLGATTPFQVALSGYDGTNIEGADLLTISGGAYSDLAFSDAAGAPLDGDWSGLYTLDGTQIFLYTDSTNNNIVLGRKGTAAGSPNAEDDTANASGPIVFAAYLEETATGAKVWMVLQEPLYHPDLTNDHDFAVDMANHLWVSATQELSFDFAGVPSGQTLFLMFADPTNQVGLVVTGRDPADQSGGEAVNTGDTVNTSQGGGNTTIGTNNQMVDPPSSRNPDGEGMIFSFVTNPVANYTVPDLTHREAIVENNIDFGALFNTTSATFVIAQMQPANDAATIKLSAYQETGALEEQGNYVNGLADDTLVTIDNVKVYSDGTKTTTLLDVSLDDAGVVIGTPFSEGGLTVTFASDGTVTVSGVVSKNALEYHTGDGTVEFQHNRVLIENAGSSDADYNGSFDIGGFFLPNVVVVPAEVGSALNFEDDGPKLAGAGSATVDEDGLTVLVGGAAGLAGGPDDFTDDNADGDNNEATAGGLLSTIFSAGNDGLSTFGLDDTAINNVKAFDTAAVEVALTSKGDAVSYDVIGDTLWGFVDGGGVATVYESLTDRAVFRLDLTNVTDAATAAYAFTLLDQLDHPATVGGDDSENELVLHLGSVLKVTDKDGDFVLGNAANLVITVDDDSPTATGTAVTGTVDEDGGLPGGIAGGPGDDPAATTVATGSIAGIFQSGADEPATFSLSSDTSGLSSTLKSQGGDVVYNVSSNMLTAYVDDGVAGYIAADDREVFTLALSGTGNATYTFTLLDQLDHSVEDDPATLAVETAFEDEILLNLGAILQATDYDGDLVTAPAEKLVITVDDDSPIAYTPDSITLVNTGTAVGTEDLNTAGKVGADEPGTIVFVDTYVADNYLRDSGGALLKSDGQNIVLSGYGTGTLLAQRETGLETVFTATLNDPATHQYTIDFDRAIDDGGGITFLGAAPVKSGNPTYNIIDNVGGTTLDLLFSGGDTSGGLPTSHSVNVSTQGAGTDNQSMNAGELLRIDFEVGVALAGSPEGRDFTAGTHQTVNGYSFLLSQNTPSGTTGTAFIQAIDADDDKLLVNDPDDTVDTITDVLVSGQTLVDNGVVTAGGVTVNGFQVNAILFDDGVVITGLNEGTTGDGSGGDDPVIKIFTADGFNRVEVSNYAGETVNSQTLGGTSFDIAPAGLDEAVEGEPFAFALPTQLTDYDGDSTPVALIGVNIEPVPLA